MILRFCFGVGHPGQRIQEPGAASTTLRSTPVAHEVVLDLLGFAGTQQPMVDEDAGELVADSLMDERGRHRRVHTADSPQMASAEPTWPGCAQYPR